MRPSLRFSSRQALVNLWPVSATVVGGFGSRVGNWHHIGRTMAPIRSPVVRRRSTKREFLELSELAASIAAASAFEKGGGLCGAGHLDLNIVHIQHFSSRGRGSERERSCEKL